MDETDLRVLVIAENLLARVGLAALIAEQDGCEVVAQVAGGQLLGSLETYEPDVAVFDLGWNVADSLTLVEALVEGDAPLVALIPNEDEAGEVIAALLPSGVYGLLPRESEADKLVMALKAVAGGLVVLDPSFANAVIQRANPAPDPLEDTLTPRENEVLQLLAQGLTNKSIAHRLGITDHTVKFHVNAIMGKLNAQSRTEAVVRATRLGLIIL